MRNLSRRGIFGVLGLGAATQIVNHGPIVQNLDEAVLAKYRRNVALLEAQGTPTVQTTLWRKLKKTITS